MEGREKKDTVGEKKLSKRKMNFYQKQIWSGKKKDRWEIWSANSSLLYSREESHSLAQITIIPFPVFVFINNTIIFILFHSSTNYPILSRLLVVTISYLTKLHVGMFFLFFQLTLSLTHVCLFIVVCDFYVFLNMDLVIIIVFYICRDFLVFYEACWEILQILTCNMFLYVIHFV